MTNLQVWEKQCRAVVAASALSVMCMFVSGCGSGGSNEGSGPSVSPASGTVTGQVVSLASNTPVSGATVKTETGTTTTAADGKFSLSAPAGDRTVVRVEASGFADAFPVARVTSGQTTNLGVKLVPIGVTETVSIAAGGTVSVPNSSARVTIPANGLVPAVGGTPAGSVAVSLTPINPAADTNLMPGGFNGIVAGGGSVQPLESGGAMQLDVRDSVGTRYTLAPGTTATIRIPLGTQSANPPTTMPLWYFDETEGLWREDGTATLQGTGANRYYEGPVTRVTYWNADLVLDSIVVNGCVKDANGQSVANARVQTEGIDYTGTAFDSTAADGTFSVAMRKSSRAKLGLFEFDRQTFNFVPVSNTVNVGPSATDINLSDCLVKQPGPLAITTAALPGGNVGVAYNQTLAASGGVPGYVWSLNTGSNPLPDGLTLNPAGVISGTPTAVGTTTITVKVTESTNATTTKAFAIAIVGTDPPPIPLTITTLGLPGGTVGTVYTTTVAAIGGAGNRSWSISAGSLPNGLSLDAATGTISGTPTAAGTSTVTIRLQDSGNPQQSAQKTFDLTIAQTPPPLTITTTSLPGGAVGTSYSQTISATGGTGARTWTVSSGILPTGLNLNAQFGVISGTPSGTGTSTLTIRVVDSGTPQQSDEQSLSLTITQAPPPPPSCGAGVTNCLTVSGASASVGGTFNGTVIGQSGNEVEWQEQSGSHIETFVFHLHNTPGLTSQLVFVHSDGITAWSCTVPAVSGFVDLCRGLTINQAEGSIALVDTVLFETFGVGGVPPITLNGTLRFTPF